MLLQTRIRLLVTVGTVATLVLGVLFFTAQQMMVAAADDLTRLNALKRELAEFLTVSMDYFDQRGDRAKAQAEAKLTQLHRLLDEAAGGGGGANAGTVSEAHQELVIAGDLLGELTSNRSNPESARDRRTERLLLLHSNGLGAALERLHAPARERFARGRALTQITITALAITLVALLVATAVLLERGALLPLVQLGNALDRVGRGDLDVRLRSTRRDEIGRVAQAFDRTLDQLQRMTVSLDRLLHEVRERERAEGIIHERTAKLEEANRELESFAYSVSHDLRAPLRAIDGFSRMLESRAGPRVDAEDRRLLGVIRTSTEHMGRLIDDLLAFSRMGRLEMRRTVVPMGELVESVLNELRAGAPERAVAVQIGELPPVPGDLAMLRQVWANLIGNAFKFSRNGAAPRVEIGGRREPGECVFWVKDNGIGFDMAHAEQLFRVFQRLHDAEQFEGTGVGLALSQRIVGRHGGRIWAEARVNEGATFYFALPCERGGELQANGVQHATTDVRATVG